MSLRFKVPAVALVLSLSASGETLQALLREYRHDEALVRIQARWPRAGAGERRQLQLLKASCHLELGQIAQAHQVLESYPLAQAPPYYFFLRAQLMEAEHHRELARQNLEHVLSLPGDSNVKLLAACGLSSLEAEDGALEQSEAHWSEAVEMATRLPRAEVNWTKLYTTRVALLDRAGKTQEALNFCRLARLQGRGRQATFWAYEAGLLRKLKREAESDRCWEQVLRGDPGSAGGLLNWGFASVYGSGNSAQRWLDASIRADARAWSGYERFHIHLLQAQACLKPLNQPALAEGFLRQAERWASPQLRPSWRGMRINLRFHPLASEQPAEMEWVLWLWKEALERQAVPPRRLQSFMESKAGQLKGSQRSPWLFELANSYQQSGDPRLAATYARALQTSEGLQRVKLLVSLLAADPERGAAYQQQLESELGGLAAESRLEVLTLLIYRATEEEFDGANVVVKEQARQLARQLLARWRQPFDARNRDLLRKDELSKNVNGQVEKHLFQARTFFVEGRLSDALAAATRALQLAPENRLLACHFSLARIQMELGQPQLALEHLRLARQSSIYAAQKQACALLEMAVYRRFGQPQKALELARAELTGARGREDLLAVQWHCHQALGQEVEAALLFKELTPALQYLLVHQPAPEPPAADLNWLTAPQFLAQINELCREYPEFNTSVPLLATSLVELAPRLPAQQALVEYFVAPHEVILMVVHARGFALVRRHVDQELLGESIQQLRAQIGKPSQTDSAARLLYQILVQPLRQELSEASLTLVCQGALLELPWDLLRTPQGQYWNQRWSLWAGEASQVYGQRPQPQILALGDVVGADLPASRREVEGLARLFPGQVQLLLGSEATQTQLRRLAPECDVIHLACHARPGNIQLSDGPCALDPIYQLTLRPGSLVVLSCCNSADAKGQQRGPITLAGAFLAAGASQVVATLTPVEDEQAEALVGSFYQALKEGNPPADALRLAKNHLQQKGAPTDWASFVLLSGLAPL